MCMSTYETRGKNTEKFSACTKIIKAKFGIYELFVGHSYNPLSFLAILSIDAL